MAKRDINIFGTSFLDLLSGALGAVILLYIIVPKLGITPDEFQEQKRLSEEISRLGLQLDELAGLIPNSQLDAIKAQMDAVIKAKVDLEKRIGELQVQNQQLQAQVADLQAKLQDALTALKKCEEMKAALDVDVGFKFKGKNILFIIDISGSMSSEDRIGQVKAGLKMLITTMGDEFSIDIMKFPDVSNGRDYSSLWSSVRAMNEQNLEQAKRYLNALKADGGTPTRATLLFALTNYSNISDIVLLSDGEPTVSGTSGDKDNIQDILSMVRNNNNQGIRINCIGVGNDFFDNKNADKVVFLRELALQNDNGFFFGF